MKTDDEHSSTRRWERLRQAAERKEFLAAKNGPWVRLEDGAGDDLERRGPLARGWRRLKAVSMVVFSGRANNKKIEPPRQPEKSERDNLLAASETDLGLNHPQPKTTAQVQPLPSPQHAAKLTSNNSVPEVVVDVAPNLPRSTETAAQQVDAVHVPTVDKMKKEQQGRCIKYSQKALGFAVCTFIGYTSAVLHSRKDNANATFNTTFKLAIAPFFVAICTDLFSLKTKGKYGSALVFLSSFHLVLMIYIVFISFDMDYAYAIPFLPLVAGASLLQQKIWPEGQQLIISTDERVSKDLDNIFDLSTLILNWSTFITAILAVFRDVHLIPEPDEQKAFSVVGLLFFLTIVLGLYLMLVTTVRTALNHLRVKYLDVLLICLLVSTLIAAVITFT